MGHAARAWAWVLVGFVACGRTGLLGAPVTRDVEAAAPEDSGGAREAAGDAAREGAQDARATPTADGSADAVALADVPPDVQDATSGLCAGDGGMVVSAWIQDASMDSACGYFLGNVVVADSGSAPIGPIEATVIYLPAYGTVTPISHFTYPAIAAGERAIITVWDSSVCASSVCPGPVEMEIAIAGHGIPSGARACGVVNVSGC
jgi:hypothetical protein